MVYRLRFVGSWLGVRGVGPAGVLTRSASVLTGQVNDPVSLVAKSVADTQHFFAGFTLHVSVVRAAPMTRFRIEDFLGSI